jgi:Fasciclin domain
MLKLKSAIFQLSIAAFSVAIFGLCTQLYVRMLLGDVKKETVPASYENSRMDSNALPRDLSLPSLYDVVRNDSRLSRFQRVLSHLPPEIIEKTNGLPTTLFAPVDEAFAQETFRWDTSPLLWYLLALYHHAVGNFTQDNLKGLDTIPTHHYADIFDSYRQPISIKYSGSSISLNHRATIIQPDVVCAFPLLISRFHAVS